MFGLGIGEILIIAVIALLVLGPDKLPDAAKTVGKTLRDFRRQTRELKDTIAKDTDLGDAMRELRSAIRDEPPPRAPWKKDDSDSAAASTDPASADSASASADDGEPLIRPAPASVAQGDAIGEPESAEIKDPGTSPAEEESTGDRA